jgi:hypothetical protein
VRRPGHLIGLAAAALFALPSSPMFTQGASKPPARAATDLDALMAQALQHRDVDRRTLSDYVLDEVESLEVLGPGKVPFTRMRREYTWYVREGIHVRSPVKFDGVPIPESDRREYEDRWFTREQERRKHRAEREAKREEEGKPPQLGPAALNEPRFVSESYFLDFKFEPGNYYLAGREQLDGQNVLRVDYYPTRLFNDDDEHDERDAKDKDARKDATGDKPADKRKDKEKEKEKQFEQDIEHKMNKTAQVTLWVDPAENRIVKYTFDNVWMDFLPAAWLVRVDDIRASMEMGQPFEHVWLPRNISAHAGVTLAAGSFEVTYRREFSKYRKADVTTRITVPKKEEER